MKRLLSAALLAGLPELPYLVSSTGPFPAGSSVEGRNPGTSSCNPAPAARGSNRSRAGGWESDYGSRAGPLQSGRGGHWRRAAALATGAEALGVQQQAGPPGLRSLGWPVAWPPAGPTAENSAGG
jgi:hypothetical protein